MPTSLRKRLKDFAEEREVHMSAIIRHACAEFLKREAAQTTPLSIRFDEYFHYRTKSEEARV